MNMIWWLLGLHLLVAGIAPFAARALGSKVMLFCALAPAATFIWVLTHAFGGLTPDATSGVQWVAGLDLELTVRVDAFALLWVGFISGIGTAVFVYSASYFAGKADMAPFAARITAFAGAMVGVVVADNLLLLYIFWELTSVTSYLLIGANGNSPAATAAARRAFVTTGAGGLAMLAGFVLLGVQTGTFSLSELVDSPPTGATASVAAVLVLAGALTKSAQFPFHGWLPGAMAAPTPASAYLHSATMVKAGIYLIARFAPIFAGTVALWRPTVLTVGIITMLFGGWVALRQHDLKVLLAYGTVSQLGFLVVLFGAGVPAVTLAAVVMLVAHALFKVTLFLVVGIVDQHAGTRDIRQLRGVGRAMPVTCAAAVVAGASMMGLPPLLGFVGKEKALEALHDTSGPWWVVLLVGVVVGSALTVAYTVRFLRGGFSGPKQAPVDAAGARQQPDLVMRGIAVIGATAGLAAGLFVVPLGDVFVSAATSLEPSAASKKVKLWAGFNFALLLSVVAITGGAIIDRGRDLLVGLRERAPEAGSWTSMFDGASSGIFRLSERTSGFVQNGSLPIYLGVTVLVTLGVPGAVVITAFAVPDDTVAAESLLQVVVALVIVAAAVMSARSERRFVAVLAVGGVGYGVALLFVIQGATDLALTQFLIETLSVVALVLVLRRLPARFDSVPWKLGRWVRLGVAGVAGISAVALTLTARSARTGVSVSDTYLERALPDGGGRNVVNVILTDFRALDTLGEISVLAIAALGITSLVVGLQERRPQTMTTSDSMLFAKLARGISPIALVFSIFLLFAGHNAPGGGFVGGLVAGAALTLEFARGGRAALTRLVPVSDRMLIGVGLSIAILTGLSASLMGGEFLESSTFSAELGLLGKVKATSALPFDIGVFLVVIGLVITMLTRLGLSADQDAPQAPVTESESVS